jgi:hypothetical protein
MLIIFNSDLLLMMKESIGVPCRGSFEQAMIKMCESFCPASPILSFWLLVWFLSPCNIFGLQDLKLQPNPQAFKISSLKICHLPIQDSDLQDLPLQDPTSSPRFFKTSSTSYIGIPPTPVRVLAGSAAPGHGHTSEDLEERGGGGKRKGMTSR